ncbi:conserved hypothetical protein [Coccidioides posadasii str. Silveira]|uniref:Rhodopsin domain-containing protein n=1 Tax=Coccidioides posadasii (strain RMSCC 757 / Silveira) TaxID=443226 RepID=E9D711_COCPS|nr:conserved hypothetical protein [Coccidioides posadasii str. Silveira]
MSELGLWRSPGTRQTQHWFSGPSCIVVIFGAKRTGLTKGKKFMLPEGLLVSISIGEVTPGLQPSHEVEMDQACECEVSQTPFESPALTSPPTTSVLLVSEWRRNLSQPLTRGTRIKKKVHNLMLVSCPPLFMDRNPCHQRAERPTASSSFDGDRSVMLSIPCWTSKPMWRMEIKARIVAKSFKRIGDTEKVFPSRKRHSPLENSISATARHTFQAQCHDLVKKRDDASPVEYIYYFRLRSRMDESLPTLEATTEIFIAERTLNILVIFLTVLGSVILIPTAYLRWRHGRLKETEVIFIVAGYLFFLAHEILLLQILPMIYRLGYVANGLMDPYPAILEERHSAVLLTIQDAQPFVDPGSHVTRFRREIRLQQIGYCTKPHESLTRNISLFGGFAADLSTDILITILPLRLIWGLHISRQRKIAVCAMFSVAILCMITAIIRLVQINSKTGITNPNVQWVALWGTVEATTAIIVGCLPTFRFLRKTSRATGAYYSQKGSGQSSGQRPTGNTPSIPLKTYIPRNSLRHSALEVSSSMESLAPTNRTPSAPSHLRQRADI